MAVGDKLEVVQYLGETYQAVEADGLCNGCESHSTGAVLLCGGLSTKCHSTSRADRKDVIWVKLQKKESPLKSNTIWDIRNKAKILEEEIYRLVKVFEDATSASVAGINLAHYQEIGEGCTTYQIEIDVRLN